MADFQDMVQGLVSAGVAVVGTVLNEAPAKHRKKRVNGSAVR
jgi:hypothetical protein